MQYSLNLKKICSLLLVAGLIPMALAETRFFGSRQENFIVETVVDNLRNPWGMAFLPEGNILITERPGKLRLVRNGRLVEQEITGLPEIREMGQGGLMGITLHPDFNNNRLVYLSYAGEEDGNYGTEVLHGRLEGMSLVDVNTIFKALPKRRGGAHFGSRLVFTPDGTLFISLGDRGASPSEGKDQPAQKLDNHLGSLIRINADGGVPEDNPYIKHPSARPEIYTYGNRNMQGMAINPETGAIWTHEHGPQGGDEVNIMRPGVNYGWPVITYGVNYGIGTKIGEGTHKTGMEQPIYKWVPSIAPSGMMFYTGSMFPEKYRGQILIPSV